MLGSSKGQKTAQNKKKSTLRFLEDPVVKTDILAPRRQRDNLAPKQKYIQITVWQHYFLYTLLKMHKPPNNHSLSNSQRVRVPNCPIYYVGAKLSYNPIFPR